MRILFASAEATADDGGGIGAYVATMTRALAERGHDVHVLSCRDGQQSSDSSAAGVTIHRRPLPEPWGPLARLGSAAADRLRTAHCVRRHASRLGSFDVIEASDWMAEGLLVRGTPLVAHLHTPAHVIYEGNGMSTGVDLRMADLLERVAVNRANTVSSPSQLLADRLRQAGWLRCDPTVIPLPVAPMPWLDVPLRSGSTPTVAVVGRVEARKSPETVVAALQHLRDIPGVRLVLVGRSNGHRDGVAYAEYVQRLARASAVDCEWLGPLSHESIAHLYQRVRAVVMASAFDNFPVAAIEAMGSARPVVCTETTGTSEIVGQFAPSLVVPFGDPAALATALRPLLTDGAHAAQIGAQARAKVLSACSPAAVARRREALYSDAVAAFEGGKARRKR